MASDSKINVEVHIESLDSDIIDEHLRASTAVLQDMLGDSSNDDVPSNAHSESQCDDEESEGNQSEQTSESFPCNQCGKYYKSRSTLLSHCRLKHPESGGEVQCEKCLKKYPSAMSLRKHIEYMHSSEYRCLVCYKNFESAEMLQSHGELCSRISSPCPICGKIFNSRLSLRSHMSYKHPQDRDNWCVLCRRGFVTERALRNHMGTMHPAAERQCGECDRAFSSAAALRSHVVYKHAKDTVRCVHCSNAYSGQARLDKHLAKCHRLRPDKRYPCGVCEAVLASTGELVHHVVSAHGDAAKNDTTNGN